MSTHVTLHVVASLDGFIARRDNTVSWLGTPADVYEAGVPEGGGEACAAIECYVMGSRTYEHALELGWPYGETPVVVVTGRELPRTRESVEFYSGDLRRLVSEVLAARFRTIWVVGGAVLGRSFLRLGLVDEMNLMVAPVMLGDGLRLFEDFGGERRWRLKNVVAYRSGYVEMIYGRTAGGEQTFPDVPASRDRGAVI